ncbi:SlyX family protein [Chitinimonas lacunae]|uniref:Protein SlyX homolog n=1 Tax=Chitinimonas lacunae TaxID=1963018 RepID=A0ABV8MN76_9NEIS
MENDFESRLTELEIRLALQDNLVDELNRVIALQQQQIDRLQAELRSLHQHVRTLEPAGRGSPEQEIPPHY